MQGKAEGKATGRKPKHGARALARLLAENDLDNRTTTAKLLRQIRQDLAEDAGGESALTNRERILVERTAGVILLCSSIENWAFKQPDLLKKEGKLPEVLGNNYLSYVNTIRLNLIAMGLKPQKPVKDLTLPEYLRQAQMTAEAENE